MPPAESTPTIWLDLTDLEGWDGPVTGIQRVSVEHLRRFFATFVADGSSPCARGFVFRSGPDRFEPARFEMVDGRPHVVAADSASVDSVPPSIGRRVLGRAPALERFVRRALHGARARRTRTPGLDRAEEPTTPRSPFTPGDTVVVLGGNWLCAGWAEQVAHVRRSLDIRLVHVVHDLVPCLAPQWAAPGGAALQGPYLRTVFGVADLVIADSEHTAHDVDQFVVQERVTRPAGSSTVVVRLATERAVVDGEPVPPHGVDPDESFVLGVGTLEIRKNHHLLYQAYALAASRGITLPMLYLVGRVGWLADATVHLLTLDPAVAPRVRLLGARTDRELAWLYEHCRYSVFPSYAEGWGLPVGESAAHGKVCITTDRSSIPEVVGACAQYVSPFDAAALLDRMVELADDATLARLEADIARQFTARTWDSVFADLCAAIGVHAR